MALNPSSHYGSEWIHIRILEQKLSFSPDYPAITGLGIGNVNDWLKDKNYKFPQPPDSLLKQIAYQLHERIFFVSPPDKAVGQLVMDFANIAAKQYGAGNAEDFYTYALRYDTTLRNKMPVQYLPEKINADSLAENNLPDKKGLGISIPLLLAIPAVLLPLTFYLYKKYFSRRK